MGTATAVKEEKDFQTRTNEYAARCIKSMKDDLDALHHAQKCHRKDCKRGSETVTRKRDDGTTYKQNVHEHPEVWHSEDDARQVIEEGHYGAEVRSDWHTPGGEAEDIEYRVCLGGGGPASQIVGVLGQFNQPESARFQFQDWFQPWTTAHTTMEQDEIMLEWVRNLYFGE